MSIILPRSLSCSILLVLIFIAPINGFDETGSSDSSIKCGGCSPCGNPSCYLSPPPPPSPLPPPPPPKKKPISSYCPPPPSSTGTGSGSGFVYMTAPPGELYPVVQNYSGSPPNLAAVINSFLGFVCLGLLIIFMVVNQ
ncbi:sulfated surface glycoprotein 185 [Spinacia oleracea]|uniref:Sulfated surface glycoprotein 185 n=1 Tax=Spinacia oleracea TaxID=3562 RepID=A0ABM3RFH4_SPIOL|nr:sulfated surface glycoprotein 185-like [Spinacia oleracea]